MTRLADCVGIWEGSNGFRLMPADALEMRPAMATVTLSAGAHLTSLAYTWEHPQDGPQDGLVVVGEGAETDALIALWGDSWHQQPEPMSMTGQIIDAAVRLEGEYGSGWRWRIVVEGEPTFMRLQMENVIPADQATTEIAAGPYAVMLMDLRRP